MKKLPILIDNAGLVQLTDWLENKLDNYREEKLYGVFYKGKLISYKYYGTVGAAKNAISTSIMYNIFYNLYRKHIKPVQKYKEETNESTKQR